MWLVGVVIVMVDEADKVVEVTAVPVVIVSSRGPVVAVVVVEFNSSNSIG